jgi:MYXO-CTERM domain-containing protein
MRRLRYLVALAPLAAGALALGCSPEDIERLGEAPSALGQPLGGESEPNGNAATATPITKDGVVRAGILPATDDDYFSFPGAVGERVFTATMTSWSPSSTDSLLDLIGPDGVTVIESDNDNGSLSASSSSIAGAALTQAGTHYLRVRPNAASTLRPYDLHVKTRSGTPSAEVEPNDTPVLAQALPSGWVAGTIATGVDVDIYSFMLNAGDTIFASLDLDPERDGTELNGALSIGPFANNFIQVNDAGGAGPDSEALFLTVKTAGAYGVAVSSPAAGTGTYQLSVSVHPAAQGNCTTYSSAAVIAIPTGPGTVTSTINVPGNPRIADIDVAVNLNHANMPDLDVVLQSPKGNRVPLFTDVGSAAFPNLDISLDDEAAFPVNSTGVLNGLAVQPESVYRLDWLDGEDAGGTWTLQLNDDTAANAGTLNSWSVTICEPPPAPVCANGSAPATPFQTDFEANDAGFTHNGTLDEWARGTPAQAPNFIDCNSGTKCFKTDLTGNYEPSSTQSLVSPPINLAGFQAPVQVSWAMKYQMESASFDHASVDVREVGGLNPKRLFEWTGATMTATLVGSPSMTIEEIAGWGVYTANLDAYAGKNVELVFHVDGDITVVYPGMAVDDVKVTACPSQICGNNAVEGTEGCDDGNTVSGDGCDANCTPTACGNAIVTMGETCDDGNTVSGDGCDANCTPTACGNTIVTAGEACDDGNAVEGDGCDSNCTASACGNAIQAPNEACDDGNTMSGDGCDANCTPTACGNTIVTAGEVCDDGNAVEGDGCDSNCTVSACGNAIQAPGEACDDGNTVEGDGCDSNCTPTGCGNGVLTLGEICDDGNGILGDGCDDGLMGNCTVSACGNGVLAGGEGCDDGNLTDNDGCDSNCTVTGCGNGVLTMNEDCDDGNAASGDGCDNNCTATACGNGVQTGTELCDDGNLDEGDGCDTNCTLSACGNGIVAGAEACDDGNTVDGDGCDSNCTATACGNGVTSDGEACDDGNDVEGDGCDSNCTASGCGNAIKDPSEDCDDGNQVDGDGCSAVCMSEGSGGAGGGGGSGGSSTGGAGGSGGSSTGGSNTGGSNTGGSNTGGSNTGGANTGGDGTGADPILASGGCACAVPGEERSSTPWAPALALAGLGLLRLRRRRS